MVLSQSQYFFISGLGSQCLISLQLIAPLETLNLTSYTHINGSFTANSVAASIFPASNKINPPLLSLNGPPEQWMGVLSFQYLICAEMISCIFPDRFSSNRKKHIVLTLKILHSFGHHTYLPPGAAKPQPKFRRHKENKFLIRAREKITLHCQV